jgi:hypothetical protein
MSSKASSVPSKASDQPTPPQCAHCRQEAGPAVELVQCSACRQVSDCGKQCQRAHWGAVHRAQCKQFRQLSAATAKQKQLGGKGLKQESPSGKRSPPQPTPEKARPVDRMQELASQPRKVLDQPDDGEGGGGGFDCPICLFCMAPEETASLPCGHMYHCECIRQLRERGVSDTCPQCRARLPPGPGQCYAEAARLTVRADRVQQSSGKQACAQAAALLEQVLQEEPGHVNAQCQFGYCFYKLGEFEKAVKWYRKAAEYGNHARAQHNLGCCYANGDGVHKDVGKAVEWCRKAAEQGHAGAQYNLGQCYCNGRGVCQDLGQAVEWLRKAADQGHAGAQQAIVDLGIAMDLDLAEGGGGWGGSTNGKLEEEGDLGGSGAGGGGGGAGKKGKHTRQ